MSLFRIVPGALLAALAAVVVVPPRTARADDLSLDLAQVSVGRVREQDGDRPYLVSIMFRSRHNTPHSTSVWVQEREPHDWVAKREWNPAVTRDGHLHNGDTRNLPAWMGRHEWKNVDVPRVDPGDRTTWDAASRSEVLGVILVMIDNNNTPPHVVRGVVNKIAGRLHQVLVAQIERGALFRDLMSQLLAGTRSPRISFDTSALTRDLFSTGDKVDLFLGLTVGSTFNPDVIVGIQTVIIPGLAGVGPFRQPRDQSRRLIPDKDPIAIRTLIVEPGNRSVAFTFDSSGASYVVRGRLDRRAVAAPTAARFDSLQVRVDTGGDDLRSGSNAVIRAIGRDGSVLGEASLNQRAELKNDSTKTVTVPLHQGRVAGVARDQLSHITITMQQGGGISADNWDIKRVIVHAVSGRRQTQVFDKAGLPLVRLTRSRPGPIPFQPFSVP